MKCSIFIKSWLQDLKWLPYSLRFIECNWREPDTEIVLVLDGNCSVKTDWPELNLPFRIHYVTPWPDGYSHAMYVKTLADTYCNGELIVLADSDLMLLSPGGPENFLATDGRLIIPGQSYEEHQAMYPCSPWRKITQRLTGEQPKYHYMASTPIAYHRSTFAGLRDKISEIQGRPYDQVVYSGTPFDYRNFPVHPITLMDYDLLGWYALRFQPERYVLKLREDLQPSKWHQCHSWTQDPAELGLLNPLCSAYSQRIRELQGA